MIFVDTNVLIDVLTPDQEWYDWSYAKIAAYGDADEELVIGQVVLAELAANFPDILSLRAALESIDIEVLPLTDDVAFAAGHAFRAYRRAHRQRDAILADFLIGGHAIALGLPLLTRDARLYRRYFPDLTLITPDENHHG